MVLFATVKTNGADDTRSAQDAATHAAEVDQLRQAILAVVSHELRSPLSGIQSWAHVLAQSLHSAMASPTAAPELPRAERALTGIVAGVRRQVEMVDNLIDAARVLSGDVSLRCTTFDMRDAISAVLHPLQSAVMQRGLQVERCMTPPATSLTTQAQPPLPDADGEFDRKLDRKLDREFDNAFDKAFDEESDGEHWQTIIADFDRTVDILRHLISNAIKFNERGGTIRLTLGLDRASVAATSQPAASDRLVVSIQNTGIGIKPEAMATLFDSFTQVDQSYSRHREGLGLGLAVANRLAQVQGGEIRAHSEGDRHGATFTLTLPREVCQAAPAPPPSRRAAPEFPSLAGLAIMVVDDQIEARESLAAVLEQSGAEVLPAESGQDAIAQLEARGATREPDVLICDIAMPGEDGYTTLSRIRAWEQDRGVVPGQRLAAIAVTAFAQREDRDRALARGYALHFAKPVDPNRLLGAVAELVAK